MLKCGRRWARCPTPSPNVNFLWRTARKWTLMTPRPLFYFWLCFVSVMVQCIRYPPQMSLSHPVLNSATVAIWRIVCRRSSPHGTPYLGNQIMGLASRKLYQCTRALLVCIAPFLSWFNRPLSGPSVCHPRNVSKTAPALFCVKQ